MKPNNKEKVAEIKAEVEKLEASGKEKWEASKQKVNEAIDDLEKEYQEVRSYFRSD